MKKRYQKIHINKVQSEPDDCPVSVDLNSNNSNLNSGPKCALFQLKSTYPLFQPKIDVSAFSAENRRIGFFHQADDLVNFFPTECAYKNLLRRFWLIIIINHVGYNKNLLNIFNFVWELFKNNNSLNEKPFAGSFEYFHVFPRNWVENNGQNFYKSVLYINYNKNLLNIFNHLTSCIFPTEKVWLSWNFPYKCFPININKMSRTPISGKLCGK